jgi:sugar phosphate isomerase/epimerase
MKTTLGVQSWCLRHFKTTGEVIEQIKATGLSCIELCGIHADLYDEKTRESTVSAYEQAGISINAIGVEGARTDEKRMRELFRFAARAGCKTILVDFPIGELLPALTVTGKLANEFEINVGIHNHGGRHWLGCRQALDYVFSLTGKRIGLALDTAWALDSHEDPVAMAQAYADRLHAVHIKDFVFDRAGKPQDVVVGKGVLDLSGLFAQLKKNSFAGSLTLEFEGDEENPVPALKKCVKEIGKYISI